MKMNNHEDSKFLNSISQFAQNEEDILCTMEVPIIKILTKYSSEQSKYNYYKKIRKAIDQVTSKREEFTDINISNNFDPFGEEDQSLFD